MAHCQFPKKNSHLQTNRFSVLELLSNIINTMLHHKKKLEEKKTVKFKNVVFEIFVLIA